MAIYDAANVLRSFGRRFLGLIALRCAHGDSTLIGGCDRLLGRPYFVFAFGQLQANQVSKCQRWPERDTGTRIGAFHDRGHVVPARIQPRDGTTGVIENLTGRVGRQTRGRSQVTRKDRDRIKWSAVDRLHAWIWLHFSIAKMPLIIVLAAAKLRVAPFGGVLVVAG